MVEACVVAFKDDKLDENEEDELEEKSEIEYLFDEYIFE